MALTLDAVRARRKEILAINRRHGATAVRIFGSVARGEADADSDLDLLVEVEAGRTLGDLVELEQELSTLLGCRVEVGTRLQARVRARVEREAVPL
jgi:predicted nucleotidyltransferase